MEEKKIQKNSEEVKTTEKVVDLSEKREEINIINTLTKDLTYNVESKKAQTTRVNKALFIELYRKTMSSVMAISKKIGIERTTFYLWMREDDKFRQDYNDIKRDLLDDVEDSLVQMIREKDGNSIRFFLKSKHPDYKPSLKVEDIRPETTFKDFMDALNDKLNEEDDKNTTNKTGDNDQPKDGEKGTLQNMDDGKPVQDKEQEGGVSEVHNESDTEVLHEEKEEKKPDIKT